MPNACPHNCKLSLLGTVLAGTPEEVFVKSSNDAKQSQNTDNEHQKTVSGKNQRAPADKPGKDDAHRTSEFVVDLRRDCWA